MGKVDGQVHAIGVRQEIAIMEAKQEMSIGKELSAACRSRLEEEIRRLVRKIENEPIATGEPMESVQLGRLQVCDELREILSGSGIHALDVIEWTVRWMVEKINTERVEPEDEKEIEAIVERCFEDWRSRADRGSGK